MVPIEHLGRALAILREKHGRTQEEVATAASVTPSMISNYERGKEKPSLDSLWKILRAMNCTFIDLEAALRLVRGDAFPLHCQNWSVTIDSPEYGLIGGGRQPGEIFDADLDLSGLKVGGKPLSVDAEQAMLTMMQLMLRLFTALDRDPRQRQDDPDDGP
ncbi:MAG: helix-turn-helix transcriptional regulator [Acidobacteriota bacterium]|nr:helix-turn-helix transcriptional regulator [Acidobacteriota bacterium]